MGSKHSGTSRRPDRSKADGLELLASALNDLAASSAKQHRRKDDLRGLTEVQTEVLFVLWEHWQKERNPRRVGLKPEEITALVNTNRHPDDPEVSKDRVYTALDLLLERGEEGPGKVGWRTLFTPRRMESGIKGGHPTSHYRLVSNGIVSWGDTALMLNQLGLWEKVKGDFNRRVLAKPFSSHLISECGFANDEAVTHDVLYCQKYEYLVTDPEMPPFDCLALADRSFCEYEFIERIAERYIKYTGLNSKLHKL